MPRPARVGRTPRNRPAGRRPPDLYGLFMSGGRASASGRARGRATREGCEKNARSTADQRSDHRCSGQQCRPRTCSRL